MNAEVKTGALVIATYKGLSDYNLDQPAFDDIEAITIAGKAADLFSSVRSKGIVNATEFEVFRKLSRLKPSNAKVVLSGAEQLNIANVSWSKGKQTLVDTFQLREDSHQAVIEATGRLFVSLDPTGVALGVLRILELTLDYPKTVEDIKNTLIREKFTEKDIDSAVTIITNTGLVTKTRETLGGQAILFNPVALSSKAQDAYRAINGLDPQQRQEAIEIIEFVKHNPGVPLPSTHSIDTLNVLVKAGIVDFSKITTINHPNGTSFPTIPGIWGALAITGDKSLGKDLIDDAKLLLNSFRYGQHFSSPGRGRIADPHLIVDRLIKSGAIAVNTPATAIGEDYPLALSRGIIDVVESRIHPGRYSMHLRKKDVAEAVRDVIAQQTILPRARIDAQIVTKTGAFVSPAFIRSQTELPPALQKFQDSLAFELRTMRRGN